MLPPQSSETQFIPDVPKGKSYKPIKVYLPKNTTRLSFVGLCTILCTFPIFKKLKFAKDTYLLVLVGNLKALLLHERFQSLPVTPPVTGSVYSTISSLKQHYFVFLTTPHHVRDLAIELKCLEVYAVCKRKVCLLC